MEIICLSTKHPNSVKLYNGITIGKAYQMIERIPGGYVRIWDDQHNQLNYPVVCFDIPKRLPKGSKQCQMCNTRFIGNNNICIKCA